MKISQAFANARKVYKKAPVDVLKFFVVELCILLAAMTPLLFLCTPKLKFLALLTLPAFVLLVFPARMNAARAMKDGLRGGKLCTPRLIATDHYMSDVLCGCKRALLVLIWAIPLIVFVLFALNKYGFGGGSTDGFTMLNEIKQFGGGNGTDDMIKGIIYLILILAGVLLALVLGLGFHSGARHAYAGGNVKGICGNHGRNLACWICALVTLLPVIVATVIAVCRYTPLLADMNKTVRGFMMGTISLPNTQTTLLILAAGAVLTLPLLPLRSLITAAFVDGLKKE